DGMTIFLRGMYHYLPRQEVLFSWFAMPGAKRKSSRRRSTWQTVQRKMGPFFLMPKSPPQPSRRIAIPILTAWTTRHLASLRLEWLCFFECWRAGGLSEAQYQSDGV